MTVENFIDYCIENNLDLDRDALSKELYKAGIKSLQETKGININTWIFAPKNNIIECTLEEIK